jgi:hypothetical protein
MKNTSAHHLDRGGERLRCQFLQCDDGAFESVLDGPTLSAVLREHGTPGRHRLYPPMDTLRLFVGQVLSTDRACQDVVGRRLSERIASGQSASALSTSAYCDARGRLSLALPTTLSQIIAQRLESNAPPSWRWQGRRVVLFDGTSVSMPDTPSLQQAYPQSATQAAGLGFPMARIGALIGLASGAVLAYQVAACKGKGTGEQTLLQSLTAHLNPGDVLLADALLATWWIIEAAKRRGADVVMAQHGKRITDFALGRQLGADQGSHRNGGRPKDHVVQWPRPPKPKSMSAEDYAAYPEFITMREIEVGGRILVTTLLDPKYASPRALGKLYAMRWNIEVDFRVIKSTLQMDVLCCKSQAMVEKEIAVCLLAYNWVRATMAKAAMLKDVLPRSLSFSAAKRLLAAFADQLRRTPENQLSALTAQILAAIAKCRLPHRPHRIEPRAKKRRPKNLPLLTVHRNVAREQILAQRLIRVT